MSEPGASEVEIYAGAEEVSLKPLPVVVARVHGAGAHRFLYLHGNPSSMSDFQPLARELAEWGEVCAFDLPGFGRSPDLAAGESLSLDLASEVVVSVLDHLGWEDAVLIGHSHGGAVAQRVAASFATRVEGLVLLGTTGLSQHANYWMLSLPGVAWTTTQAGRLFPLLPLTLRRGLVRFFMRALFEPHHVTADEVEAEVVMLTERPHILKTMARVTWGEPCRLLAQGAGAIKARTLVLHGTLDPVVPIRYGRGVHAAISGARWVELQGVGHMLTLHATERVASEIGGFLVPPTEELGA